MILPVGNNVKANDTGALVVINQIAPVQVGFAVPDRYLNDIRAFSAKGSLPVRATPQGTQGVEAVGRLTFIDNAVDPQTGTIRLAATFANTARELWPGQFVTAKLTLQEQANVVVVPSQAIQNGPRASMCMWSSPTARPSCEPSWWNARKASGQSWPRVWRPARRS